MGFDMAFLINTCCAVVVSLQYIPRNMHTVFALLCFVVVIHWLISPYPSGLLHWHCGNLTIAPVPAKQPWWIWINTTCEFIMNDCITTTKQSTTKPCAYFMWDANTYWCFNFSGILTLYVLNFSAGTKNIYFFFMSFLHIDMTQVVEILPQVGEEHTYST